MPTVVDPGGSSPAMARQLASSHRAMSRGVPRTGTVPDPRAIAVSASVTTSFASPRNPVATLTTSQAMAIEVRLRSDHAPTGRSRL